VTVVAGMFESISDDHLIYNSAVVVDASKGLVGSYRKRYLFDAFGETESERFRPGSEDPLLVAVTVLRWRWSSAMTCDSRASSNALQMPGPICW
jgi:predicted amidohydrolase